MHINIFIQAKTAVLHKNSPDMCKIFVYVKYTKPIDELCFMCYNTKHQQEAGSQGHF